jgi:formylglycine-generating enzyme required for sulfatase activity
VTGSRDSYTRHARAILWLLREGALTLRDPGGGVKTFRVPAFYIGKTPITNRQFEAFEPRFRRTPCSAGDDDSVVSVSFRWATAYCEWYASLSRKPIRLPTEIEWEYACRAGTTTRCFFGDDPEECDSFMWDLHNSGGVAGRPQAKRPNGFGLHGMLGGVWEWTSSVHGPAVGSEESAGAPADARRVLRGGSFRVERGRISSSLRRGADPDLAEDDVGFRIVRDFSV